MNGEQKFWVFINSVICITIIAITSHVTDYWKDHNDKIVQLIEQGADPIAVMCAMQDDYGTNPVCLMLAAKTNK